MKTLLIPIALAACTEVPASPSFQQDVAPILTANCARCHGAPVIGGALNFRVTYSNIADQVSGAANVSGAIQEKVVAKQMPPRYPLDDDQIEIVDRWVTQGAQRGEPRPGNQSPRAKLTQVGAYAWSYELDDPDRDHVGAYLVAGDFFVGELHGGRGTLVWRWEPSMTPDGTYPLVVRADDGAAEISIPLGEVTIP